MSLSDIISVVQGIVGIIIRGNFIEHTSSVARTLYKRAATLLRRTQLCIAECYLRDVTIIATIRTERASNTRVKKYLHEYDEATFYF